ncbi:MAG: hypothetical protein ABH800_01575 [Candidatus Nealsonbacteria bacterium]
MKENILLSKRAKWNQDNLLLTETSFLGLQFCIIIFLLAGATSIIMGLIENIPVLAVLGLLLLATSGVFISFYRKKEKQIKKVIEKQNFEDWELSKKIEEITEFLIKNPPNFQELIFPGLEVINNLKPVRIDFFSQNKIMGEFEGSFKGRGFGLFAFSVSGKMSGNIKGESTPELTDLSTVLICEKEDGDVLRLICPSTRIIIKSLAEYFQNLAKSYEAGSYTCDALFNLWQKPLGLKSALKKINPQRIYDYLIAKIELPLKERPNISIKGIPLKEGAVLITLIECESKGSEIIIPVDFIDNIKTLLEEKLKKSLPEIPLLES